MGIIISILTVCLLFGLDQILQDSSHKRYLRRMILTLQEDRQFPLEQDNIRSAAQQHRYLRLGEDATFHQIAGIYNETNETNETPILQNHVTVEIHPEIRFYFANIPSCTPALEATESFLEALSRESLMTCPCEGIWMRNNGECIRSNISEGAVMEPRTECPECGGDIRQMGHSHFCLACDWDNLGRKFN